uniref:Uncharacterized protein n=1 Tax=Rhizophora mucronata TaxID=61149 RepID=A0A2P2QIF3_RHIMU
MTNYTEDAKAETEEQNSEGEELDDLRWDICKLQKAWEELKARILNEKSNLSRSNSNPSTKPYVSCALRNKWESRTKPKANAFDFSSEDEYGGAYTDEKSICENGSEEAGGST